MRPAAEAATVAAAPKGAAASPRDKTCANRHPLAGGARPRTTAWMAVKRPLLLALVGVHAYSARRPPPPPKRREQRPGMRTARKQRRQRQRWRSRRCRQWPRRWAAYKVKGEGEGGANVGPPPERLVRPPRQWWCGGGGGSAPRRGSSRRERTADGGCWDGSGQCRAMGSKGGVRARRAAERAWRGKKARAPCVVCVAAIFSSDRRATHG